MANWKRVELDDKTYTFENTETGKRCNSTFPLTSDVRNINNIYNDQYYPEYPDVKVVQTADDGKFYAFNPAYDDVLDVFGAIEPGISNLGNGYYAFYSAENGKINLYNTETRGFFSENFENDDVSVLGPAVSKNGWFAVKSASDQYSFGHLLEAGYSGKNSRFDEILQPDYSSNFFPVKFGAKWGFYNPSTETLRGEFEGCNQIYDGLSLVKIKTGEKKDEYKLYNLEEDYLFQTVVTFKDSNYIYENNWGAFCEALYYSLYDHPEDFEHLPTVTFKNELLMNEALFDVSQGLKNIAKDEAIISTKTMERALKIEKIVEEKLARAEKEIANEERNEKKLDNIASRIQHRNFGGKQ